jgi:hypothetical protein
MNITVFNCSTAATSYAAASRGSAITDGSHTLSPVTEAWGLSEPDATIHVQQILKLKIKVPASSMYIFGTSTPEDGGYPRRNRRMTSKYASLAWHRDRILTLFQSFRVTRKDMRDYQKVAAKKVPIAILISSIMTNLP